MFQQIMRVSGHFFAYLMFNAVKSHVCRKSLGTIFMDISNTFGFGMKSHHSRILSNILFNNHCKLMNPRSTKETKLKVLKLSEENWRDFMGTVLLPAFCLDKNLLYEVIQNWISTRQIRHYTFSLHFENVLRKQVWFINIWNPELKKKHTQDFLQTFPRFLVKLLTGTELLIISVSALHH